MAAALNWRSAIGLCSQSSGTELVYDSPKEDQDEDPPLPSLAPATKKRQHAESEKDLDEISTGSDEYNPTDKMQE